MLSYVALRAKALAYSQCTSHLAFSRVHAQHMVILKHAHWKVILAPFKALSVIHMLYNAILMLSMGILT